MEFVCSIVAILLANISQGLTAPNIKAPNLDLGDSIEHELALIVQEVDNEFELVFKDLAGVKETLKLIMSETAGFSPGFKYGELDVDENGQLKHLDLTSSIQPEWIKKNVYTSPDRDHVHLFKDFRDGQHVFEGLLDDKLVKWNGVNHMVLHNPPNSLRPFNINGDRSKRELETDEDDTVDPHRTLTYGRAIETGPVVGHVELALLYDYTNSKLFEFDMKKLIDYSSVYIDFINKVYSSSEEPKITFSLVDVFVTKSPELETYILESENTHIGNGSHARRKLLDLFKAWCSDNRKTLGTHDLISLVYGQKLDGPAVGIAVITGACGMTPTSDISTSIVMDWHGVWGGRLTMVHELGHNLGAVHDSAAAGCPSNLGHILGGNFKRSFSECSKSSMIKFLRSEQAACLKKNDRTPINTNTDSITNLNLNSVCKNLVNESFAQVADYRDPNETCQGWLRCTNITTGPDGKIEYIATSVFYPIENGMKCGRSGVCENKVCVGNKPLLNKAELDLICKEKLKDSNAIFNRGLYGTQNQCRNLACEGSNKKTNLIPFWLGDGAPCMNDGSCVDGNCQGSKGYSKSDLDLICQGEHADTSTTYIHEDTCSKVKCFVKGWTWSHPFDRGMGSPCGKDGKGKCTDKGCVGG